MVDRESRDKLCEAITAFQDDAIGAFDFDSQIFDICDNTKDQTVREVVFMLWYFYDDCKDHKINVGKQGWDVIERLRLLLVSNSEFRKKRKWMWSMRQPAAVLALVGFVAIAWLMGLGIHLLIVAIPFGLISFAISKIWREDDADVWPDMTLTPFGSYAELSQVRRRIPGFTKNRYRNSIRGRRIRSPFMHNALMTEWLVMWMLFSPVVLFVQSLPSNKVTAHIITPSVAAAS